MPSPPRPSCGGHRSLRVAGTVFVFRRELVAAEVEVEAFVEQVLLVGRLRQHERQGVLQDRAVGEAHHLHRTRGVDALCGGDAYAGTACGLQELAKGFGSEHATPPPNPLPQGEGE